MSEHLATIRPIVQFFGGNGQPKGEPVNRAIRIAPDGQLGVMRRSKLYPVEIVSAKRVNVSLSATPLATGVTDAQEIAPVASLERLLEIQGIERAGKDASATGASATKASDLEKALLGLSEDKREVAMAFLSALA